MRVQRASQRVTALNERYLRRIGADLHDGPAQLVALAALRLDSPVLSDPATPAEKREREISGMRASLDEAMREIRNICNGLVLPHIESAELPEILQLAVRAHEQRTETVVALSHEGSRALSPSEKICIYRFVQEALNNGFRHAGGTGQSVTQYFEAGRLVVQVSDNGPGFDQVVARPEGLGLAGLRERVESLGGRFAIHSSAAGTTVMMSLTTQEETEQA